MTWLRWIVLYTPYKIVCAIVIYKFAANESNWPTFHCLKSKKKKKQKARLQNEALWKHFGLIENAEKEIDSEEERLLLNETVV